MNSGQFHTERQECPRLVSVGPEVVRERVLANSEDRLEILFDEVDSLAVGNLVQSPHVGTVDHQPHHAIVINRLSIGELEQRPLPIGTLIVQEYRLRVDTAAEVQFLRKVHRCLPVLVSEP